MTVLSKGPGGESFLEIKVIFITIKIYGASYIIIIIRVM